MSEGEHNYFCWPEEGEKKRTQNTRRKARKDNGYPGGYVTTQRRAGTKV